MMEATKKLLRHGMGLGKVQVHCASQEKYGIAQGAYWFQRCVQVAGVDDGGDGSVRECMSEWGKDPKTDYFPPPIFACTMIDTWLSWSSFLSTWDSFPLP
jgi:hypothetical protein